MPFFGQLMKCILCDAKQRSDPTVESQWRAIVFLGRTFYACPDHFPPDDTGTREQFTEAYYAFFEAALKQIQKGATQ